MKRTILRTDVVFHQEQGLSLERVGGGNDSVTCPTVNMVRYQVVRAPTLKNMHQSCIRC
jgi:hypothetical protein